MPSANSQIEALQAQVAELRQTVDSLTAEQDAARAQARQVTRPVGIGDPTARQAEKDRHEAWKRSRRYGPPPTPKAGPPLVQAPDLLATMYPSKAELAQKEAIEQRARANAARRAAAMEAERVERAERAEPVQPARAVPNPYALKAPIVVHAGS